MQFAREIIRFVSFFFVSVSRLFETFDFLQNWAETMPCCEISDRAQMSKTIIAVRHFALGGRESLETAVTLDPDCTQWKLKFG